MELIEYWYLLLRRKSIILKTLMICATLGFAYAFLATPIYEANGKLLLVQDNGFAGISDLGGSEDLMLSAIGKKTDPLMTQIEMMKTRPVLQQTIDTLKLTNKNGLPMSPEYLLKTLSFSIITNTNMIRISCKERNPILASDILNTLADIYMSVNRDINRESATVTRAFIEEQLITQKDKLDSAEDALARYKTKTGTISLEQETELKIGGIARLESEMLRVEAELQGMEAEIESFNTKLDAPGARNSSHYTQWRSSLEEAQLRIATTEAHRKKLKRKIAQENYQLNLLPAQEIRFANLLRDRQIAKDIYAGLLESFEQFKIREVANTSSIKIVEPAIIPLNPVEPKKMMVLLYSILGGSMIGLCLALLMEYLDDTPQSIEDIKKVLPYHIMGYIPWLAKLDPFYMEKHSDSFAAESMRLIHANMRFAGIHDKGHQALMITSSQPGEGKTTTCVNMAYTYAEQTTKTAVVNLDLRRPTFKKMIKHNFSKGITDYLVGDATLDEIQYDYAENLTIIPAGTIPPNPSALIRAEMMSELIAILKEQFDVVIFDMPPITLVAEALDVAPHMDGIIIVTDITNSSMRMVRDMASILDGKELPILGMVVNKMNKDDRHYYDTYRTSTSIKSSSSDHDNEFYFDI